MEWMVGQTEKVSGRENERAIDMREGKRERKREICRGGGGEGRQGVIWTHECYDHSTCPRKKYFHHRQHLHVLWFTIAFHPCKQPVTFHPRVLRHTRVQVPFGQKEPAGQAEQFTGYPRSGAHKPAPHCETTAVLMALMRLPYCSATNTVPVQTRTQKLQ
jgi:hypothetical protein